MQKRNIYYLPKERGSAKMNFETYKECMDYCLNYTNGTCDCSMGLYTIFSLSGYLLLFALFGLGLLIIGFLIIRTKKRKVYK